MHPFPFTLFSGRTSYRDVVVASGPLLYWRLNETTGTYADEMGAYTGTQTGTITRGVTGAIVGDSNKAITFGGGRISTTGLSGVLTNAAKVSLEFWFTKPSTNFPYYVLACLGDAVNALMDNTSISFGSQNSQYRQFAVPAPSTTWRHFVGVYDGTLSGSARAKVYVDGIALTTTGGGTPAANVGTATEFTPGYMPSQTWRSSVGNMDEVALYAKALTAEDALAHYNKGMGN